MLVRLTRLPLVSLLWRTLGVVLVLLVVVGASMLAVAAHLVRPHASALHQPAVQPAVAPQGTISTSWYFAEGYTGSGYTEFLTLANFNSVSATVTVTYYLDTAAPLSKQYAVSAHARTTLNVGSEVGGSHNVAMAISSTQPIVAERPMYFNYLGNTPGGTDVLGATHLGTSYYFPYLDTTINHDNWLAILNPSTSSMTVTIHYYPEAGGMPVTVTHTVAAQRRGTFEVDSESGIVTGAYYWAQVSLSTSGLVERTLYVEDLVTGYTGGSAIVGLTTPQTSWSFAEGHTDTAYSERYVLVNPSLTSATLATLTFFKTNGSTVVTQAALAPGELELINVNNVLGSGAVDNGAQVQATGAIFAERIMSMHYTYAVGGSNSSSIPGFTETPGTPAPGITFYFSEGYTGTAFAEWLSLLNPDATNTATVTVTLQPSSGGSSTVKTYTVGPHTRYGVFLNSVLSNQNISMLVQSTVNIVAERVMYFTYGSTQTGADAVIGYQP